MGNSVILFVLHTCRLIFKFIWHTCRINPGLHGLRLQLLPLYLLTMGPHTKFSGSLLENQEGSISSFHTPESKKLVFLRTSVVIMGRQAESSPDTVTESGKITSLFCIMLLSREYQISPQHYTLFWQICTCMQVEEETFYTPVPGMGLSGHTLGIWAIQSLASWYTLLCVPS